MHPVCGISELLEIIFSNLDDQSNTSNAQVCRQWGECALNILWYEVTDFRRLFRILVPMRKEPIGASMCYKFTRQPEVNDWRNFDRYRPRVRTRTSLNVLPNLRTLQWDAPLRSGIVFMHDNVTDLRLHPRSPELGSPCFREIVARMPNITHLELHPQFPMSVLVADIVKVIRSMKLLRNITLPRETPAAGLMEAISGLHALHTLTFPDVRSADFWSLQSMRPSLNEGAFYSLSSLSICICFEDAIYLFNMLSAPSKLHTIRLDSPKFESLATIHDLLVVVGKLIPSLESFELQSVLDADGYTTRPITQNYILDINTIRSLFKCREIVRLKFMLPHSLHLRESDVEVVARAWPCIQRLALNSMPNHLHSCVLTLDSLIPFARYCPDLEILALFIRADKLDIAHSAIDSTLRWKVHSFFPGFSDIEDPGVVSLSLSRIFPLWVTIIAPCPVTSPTMLSDTLQTMQSHCDKWKKVSEMLPLLMQARMEERNKMRRLMQSGRQVDM
ncbi:hypothetical protein Hypma_005426 [Hypsizygus marmoreus]|uniref:F-box domain-containing protein n=1 Tax=Hypsizygus marmoreus TaxID=39966 RepID=A0A369J5U2_HYPMA|nr:hypothetical protein Hypma_005426 [Hypsizygus marmoreus]